MRFTGSLAVNAPERAEIDALRGLILSRPGVGWYGNCQPASGQVDEVPRFLRHRLTWSSTTVPAAGSGSTSLPSGDQH